MSDEQRQKVEERDDDSSSEAFYDAGSNKDKEQNLEAPSITARKSKMIKKSKKKTESKKKDSDEKKRKEHMVAANDTAKAIIEQMRNCYEKDLRLYQAKKKANNKLKYIGELQKKLRNVYICDRFLENGGLDYFQSWLRKLPDGTESSLTLRKKVFNILLTMNAVDQHIDKVPELKKLIQKNKRNPLVKDLCESIINKWGSSMM